MGSDQGFALVAALMMMLLIALIAFGMAGLASIELRRTGMAEDQALARANARLALMQAIGQLQRTLGPDQRVSATAEILPGSQQQPHWTGVWKSTQDDGTSFFKRDDLSGGLSDIRSKMTNSPKDRVIEWLVSGRGDPVLGAGSDAVVLFNVDGQTRVEAPRVTMRNSKGGIYGHHAWWTGDLGVRANVATRDPREPSKPDRNAAANGAWYRLMANQAADTSMMTGGVVLVGKDRLRMASSHTAELTEAGATWVDQHALDFTVDSIGVLANVADGGLKSDLTAFFQSDGTIAPYKNLPGISASDPLLAKPGETGSRLSKISPRMGLLRDWARLGIPFAGKNASARLAEADNSAGGSSEKFSLANETPVKLAGNVHNALQPILVEATNYIHISTFKVEGWDPPKYQLRHMHYPRVVLWNPYNVELDFQRAIIMIQGNGRQEMWTDNDIMDSTGKVIYTFPGQWLSFEGGRSTSFNYDFIGIMNTEGYNDPYIGSYYFAIPRTRFAPGECLVFSPARLAEYDCLSPYRPGPYNLNNNELSCTVSPDPARCYYISGTDIDGGMMFLPVKYWFAPTPAWGANGVANQSDDTRAIMKSLGDSPGTVTFEVFDSLPQIAVCSASLQYGAGREPRISWNKDVKMPMELLDQHNPAPTVVPDVRTRESIRLRWFDEHTSNRINSGPLNGTPHFEEALLANWNPRASFAMRSPWENIAGAGEPWFFGAYTRDLYDQAVSWEDQAPFLSGGRYHGNPFGPPQEGARRHVLFDVPREETGVISLGQLQHAKLSELIWHPSYAIGNSLVDPRLGDGPLSGLAASAAKAVDSASSRKGGFHENQLGWSSDAQRAKSRSEWAETAAAMLGDLPETENLVYDLSFEANHALWDRFFISSGSTPEKNDFLSDPSGKPLPNARMKPANAMIDPERLRSFQLAASALMVDGAFNVNSTRVEAWKALLASSRLVGYGRGDNVPFPRVLDAPGGAWKNGDPPSSEDAWSGYRELTPGEIDRLARAIVDQVRLRGPFISLADFVNRRLADNETGRMGALEAAIRSAGLNSTLISAFPLDNSSSLPDYSHQDNIPDATRLEQTLKPDSKAWGAPAWLTQGDLLQSLAPVLTARSDSFVIRCYGDATDDTGRVKAMAWCEAVVQRMPEPIEPDESGINPRLSASKRDFGRRFVISSFRWLSPGEI